MTKPEHKQWEQEMSTQFNVMMDGIRTQQMPEDSLERSLQAAEAITMTKAAQLRGYKNALIGFAIVYPIIAAIAYGISRLLNTGMLEGFIVAGMVWSAFFFLVAMVLRLLGRAQRGDVLMDCGPFPARSLAFTWSASLVSLDITGAVGVLAIAVGLNLTLQIGSDPTVGTIGIVLIIAGVVASIIGIRRGRGRLLICKNGLFLYWALMRWDKIESYRWEGTTDATLMLQGKGRFGMMKRGALPIAIEQKDQVDALLQKHVGK